MERTSLALWSQTDQFQNWLCLLKTMRPWASRFSSGSLDLCSVKWDHNSYVTEFQVGLPHTICTDAWLFSHLFVISWSWENFWFSCGAFSFIHSFTNSLIHSTSNPEHFPCARHYFWTGNAVGNRAKYLPS